MLRHYKEIYKNMGWRYFSYRAVYELRRKTGLLKKKFPTTIPNKHFITLAEWRQTNISFFFENKDIIKVPVIPSNELNARVKKYENGEFLFFSGEWLNIGNSYDWMTNPTNGYKYDTSQHWTEVKDYSPESGDIKYVWEKSRFSFLYDLIRYDYHNGADMGEVVFSEIDNWIESNKINAGPNWRCSQEISLRILNWTFALFYYKQTNHLTEERFERIINSIYTQLLHVRENIDFSRICVRNNHAITETLTLYIASLLYPFIPKVREWKEAAKKWFEEEIIYQIYSDGAYLQFSHNYHRVVIQLITWAFYLSELNGEFFCKEVYQRAHSSLNYLFQFMNPVTGHLPNYGANDGALFFKLSEAEYRDYRPQLNALHFYFTGNHLVDSSALQEDTLWYSSSFTPKKDRPHNIKAPDTSFVKRSLNAFQQGGDFLFRDNDSFTFIKCNSFRDRPAHADNLHMDVWYKDQNILRDAGSYRYNAQKELVTYFNGTRSHNTVVLGDFDQMEKGPRFIWFNWSKSLSAGARQEGDVFVFEGSISAFKAAGENIIHKRRIRKQVNTPHWEIEDEIINKPPGLSMKQMWNPSTLFYEQFSITASTRNGDTIPSILSTGFYSEKYGILEKINNLYFETEGNYIKTIIKFK